MIIKCPHCQTIFNVKDEKIPSGGGKLRCFKCREIFSLEDGVEKKKTLVLIANDDVEFCNNVSDMLSKNGLASEHAYDGVDALNKIQDLKPDVALLDVALPRMFGFDVCDAARQIDDVKDVKIILIAAIYDKTRYKRSPSTLYGADDYIEKHHIYEHLMRKIGALVPLERGEIAPDARAAGDTPAPPERPEEIGNAPARANLSPRQEEDHEKARRLARIIVSDIALYNEQLLAEGRINNNYHDLFKNDLEEGRSLFRQRVPKEIWEKRDYLMETFDEFIESHAKTD